MLASLLVADKVRPQEADLPLLRLLKPTVQILGIKRHREKGFTT